MEPRQAEKPIGGSWEPTANSITMELCQGKTVTMGASQCQSPGRRRQSGTKPNRTETKGLAAGASTDNKGMLFFFFFFFLKHASRSSQQTAR